MANASKIRILLVDDSPEQRATITALLQDPHIEVVEAYFGEEGLALLKESKFAMVLIDVRMPGMNGFELAERIRALKPAQNLPIIFLTAAQAPEAHIRKGYSLGAVDFLILPVIPEILRAKMAFFTNYFQKVEIRERQAEAVTQTLTDNAPSGLFMLDGEKRITFMNPAAGRILGQSFQEIQGLTLHEIVHGRKADGPPCAQEDCALLRALDSHAVIRNLPEVFSHKEGRSLSVSCSLSPLPPSAGSPGIVVDFQDISEHKQAEDRLKKSEDRYRRLFETSRDGILILDAEKGRIMDVNPFLSRLLQYSKEELVGKELWEIGLFKDIEANQEAFLTLKREGYVRYDDLPLKSKRGENKEVEFVSNSYPEGGDTVIQCNIRDVTERKRAEENLHRIESDLRQSQKVEALGKLSGGIAHDFNNLLTAINGYTSLCMSMPGTTDNMREHLSEILQAGHRAAELTHQLLAFSRKQVLQPKVMNLNGVVKEVLALLRRIIGDNIKLTQDLEPHLWLVRADPSQIHQVIMNLMANARDALPQGGEITIRTRNRVHRQGPVSDNAAPESLNYVLLSVSDSGVGMTDEIKARIFDPFYTTKEFGRGTGMGLATVDGIVQQSGGNIVVESSPGSGSTFGVYLPKVEDKIEPVVERPEFDLESFRGEETILLTEDDTMVRTFTRRILEMYGFTVLEAHDGERALELIHQHGTRIQLLLTDMLMPGINGRELAEKFRAICADAPVLFMSGYTDEIIINQGLLEEGSLFIKKPFLPNRLIEVIKGIFADKLQPH